MVLAMFSALTHRNDPQAGGVLQALAAALDNLSDPAVAGYLAEFTEVGLGDTAAREIWRNLMSTLTYHYPSQLRTRAQEEGWAKGLAEGEAAGLAAGKAEGEATAILRVLAARGVDVPDDARARIAECTDLDQLQTWVERAATATAVD